MCRACVLESGNRHRFAKQVRRFRLVEKDCVALAARQLLHAALAIGAQKPNAPDGQRRGSDLAQQQRHALEVAGQCQPLGFAAEQSARPAPPMTVQLHCRRRPPERWCREARRPAQRLPAQAACERRATASVELQHETRETKAPLDAAAPNSCAARQPCAARCGAALARVGHHQQPRREPSARRRWLLSRAAAAPSGAHEQHRLHQVTKASPCRAARSQRDELP